MTNETYALLHIPCPQIDAISDLISKLGADVSGSVCDATKTVANVANDATDAAGNIINSVNLELIQGTGDAVKSADVSSITGRYSKASPPINSLQ